MFDVPPDSAAAYLFTARMLLRQEFDPIAEEYAQKAAALDPKLPLVHYLLGELYTYKSRIPEAIAEFQKELAINPANAATYYKLADAYSRIQKYEEAQRLLQRSIWLDQTSTGPFILMGKVLEKKGELRLGGDRLEDVQPTWTPTIRSRITCWARPTATWGRKKKRRANSNSQKNCKLNKTPDRVDYSAAA